ncbi:hypothetical protein CHCC20335_4504 [Bacillus paralicheniformis]|nr:hypothetical protein CHCC20335_4504 [Bacillus paralicheniformis]
MLAHDPLRVSARGFLLFGQKHTRGEQYDSFDENKRIEKKLWRPNGVKEH